LYQVFAENETIDFNILENKRMLKSLISEEIIDFMSNYVSFTDESTVFLETASKFNIDSLKRKNISEFINLKRINDIKFLNKFFQSVNFKMQKGGVFICCAETIAQRQKRILKKYPKIISYPYYVMDFILKRVFPKTRLTMAINSVLTSGRNRALSLAEILGRLISCGFEIVEYKEFYPLTVFAVKKVKLPIENIHPSYGLLFKMRRIGQNGKEVFVYKIRTMHPYAEFLQEYIFKTNNLQDGGKLKNDFRITAWGRFLRKTWLDELPMLFNWIKRDLKLVGVRPISQHYLSLYRKDLIEKRLKVKPGLVPPFYADLPKTLDEIMDSEERYLDSYEKSPIKTDIKYFFKAANNILIKNARSS